MPVIVGAKDAVTANMAVLFVDPLGVVTEIVPVVAVGGTVTTRMFVEADVMGALVPLIATVFRLGVALNPVP